MQLAGWEAFFFYALAFLALFFAIFTITARNAVHSALFLMSTLICAAGLFILLQAEFLAGVQILVYVGGVLVLFLFVIMLVNVREENVHIYTRQFWLGGLIVFVLGAALLTAVLQTQSTNFFNTGKDTLKQKKPETNTAPAGTLSQNTQNVGMELYQRAALPFEIASVLLLVAIIGAVLLARERKQEQLYD
ncbi:MAG: NADH-quinone oxidoreductase subunit J [Acidobacteriota bacterium]